MAASFLKQLGATDKFLGQIKNLPSAAAVQSQQCKQLVEQTGKVSAWSSEEASEACELVHNLLYVAEDGKKQLLEAIAACNRLQRHQQWLPRKAGHFCRTIPTFTACSPPMSGTL